MTPIHISCNGSGPQRIVRPSFINSQPNHLIGATWLLKGSLSNSSKSLLLAYLLFSCCGLSSEACPVRPVQWGLSSEACPVRPFLSQGILLTNRGEAILELGILEALPHWNLESQSVQWSQKHSHWLMSQPQTVQMEIWIIALQSGEFIAVLWWQTDLLLVNTQAIWFIIPR